MDEGVFVFSAIGGVHVAPIAAPVPGEKRLRHMLVLLQSFKRAGGCDHPAKWKRDVRHLAFSLSEIGNGAPAGRQALGDAVVNYEG